MKEAYRILYRGGSGETVEKKSRFIATLQPVRTEEEAMAFVQEMKKKYWDANHNCYAWVIGHDAGLQRCSDDGEPSQTAGRPMLDVLLGEEICDVCAVVTRYFGGTLLGTGGLVRAYGAAVQAGLRQSLILEKRLGRELLITTDYNGIGKIQYILAQRNITLLDTEYTDKVVMKALAPVAELNALKAELTEGLNGRAGLAEQEDVYYGILEKKVLLLS